MMNKTYAVLLRSKEKHRRLTGMDGAFEHSFRFYTIEITARSNREALSLARSEAARHSMLLVRVARMKRIYENVHHMSTYGTDDRRGGLR